MYTPYFAKTVDNYIVAGMKVLLNAAPGYTYLNQFRDLVEESGGGVTGLHAYGSALANYVNPTADNAALAASIVANLGITGDKAGIAAANIQALLDGAGANRGAAIMRLVDIMIDLQSDSVWGVYANNFVNAVNLGYQYSINPANNTTELSTLQAAIADATVEGNLFTLTESVREIDGSTVGTVTETRLYWGNAQTKEGIPFEDTLIPVGGMLGFNLISNLINSPVGVTGMATIITGVGGVLDALGNLLDVAGIDLDNITLELINNNALGVGARNVVESVSVVEGGQNQIIVGDDGFVNIVLSKTAAYTGNYDLIFNLDSEDMANAQVQLTSLQFELLRDLLFDADGNMRLFEKTVTYQPQQALTDGDGNVVRDIDGNLIPVDLVQVDGRKVFQPIVLTPTQNNGGTLEQGFTDAADNTIVVGRLDLLHQAYIDAAAGYDTLEVDAKGYFAQPLQLLNIEHIRVQNLPNIYDYTNVNPGDIGEDFNYGRNGDGFLYAPNDMSFNQYSILDLSRATSLQKLTVTEGGFTNTDQAPGSPGSLILSGIRNAAELNLEGGFTQNVVLNYGAGNTGNGLNIVLNNVDFMAGGGELKIAHNANVFNIASLGGDNHLNGISSLNNATLSTINVSGSAHLHIDDLAAIYNNVNGRLATFNAAQNTGGVNIGFVTETNGGLQDRISFTGSQGNDVLTVNSSAKEVTVNNAAGANRYIIDASEEISITDGTGNNRYELKTDDGGVVNVSAAGEGRNTLTLEGTDADSEVTIDFAGNRNSVTLKDEVDTATITLGGENGMVFVEEAVTATVTAQGGRNTIDLVGENLTVTAGGSNNNVLLNGTYDRAAGIDNGALLNVTFTGNGNNSVVLGHPLGERNDGVTALEGSSISGSDVSLTVLDISDLRAAELDGISSVVMNAELTLTIEQFLAIGPEAFDSYRQIFGTEQTLNLIVNNDTDLSGVDLSSLREFNFDTDGNVFQASGIVLNLLVGKGAELTLTAEQLHYYVDVIESERGAISSNLLGSVTIVGAGPNFDPYTPLNSDYNFGGRLSSDFDGSGNVTVIRDGTFERPGITGTVDILTLDSDTLSGPITSDFTTLAQTLKIVGDSDVVFADGTVVNMTTRAQDGFTLDFSELGGNLTGLTLAQIGGTRTIKEILGNNTDTRINVELDGHVGSAEQGLVSSGVETYMVTGIDVPQLNPALLSNLSAAVEAYELSPVLANGVALQAAYTALINAGLALPAVTFNPAGNSIIVSSFNDGTIQAAADAFNAVQFWTCETTQDLQTLGLTGNYDRSVIFGNVNADTGIEFLMEAVLDKNFGYSVGTLTGAFARPGANAVVNVTLADGVVLPADQALVVAGINTINARTITVNVTGGDAVIEALNGAGSSALAFNSADDVSVVASFDLGELAQLIPATLDASGVEGDFAATLTGAAPGAGLSFSAAQGATTLTLDDVTAGFHSSFAAEEEADFVLVVTGETDLAGATLTNVDTIRLGTFAEDGTQQLPVPTLHLTVDQVDAIGAANIVLGHPTFTANLNLTDLSDQPFSMADFADGIAVSVTLAVLPEITLHPETDLTGFTGLEVNAITTLTLSADQLVQLFTSGGEITGDGRVVVTGFTQAHLDAMGEYAGSNDMGFGFVGTDVVDTTDFAFATTLERITINVDGDLALGAYTESDNIAENSVVVGDDSNLRFELNGNQLTLSTYEQANELRVNGGNVKLDFVSLGTGNTSIDMADYTNIGEVEVYAMLITAYPNTENLFLNLASSVPDLWNVIRVVEDPEGLFIDRAVIVNPGVTTNTNGIQFITPTASQHDENVGHVWISLMGDSTLAGNIVLDRNDDKDNYFQTLTINSLGEAANSITGGITANGSIGGAGVGTPAENNLLNIVINAEADLSIGVVGKNAIVFQSVVANATARLTLTGDADVTFKGLDATDPDVANLIIDTDAYSGTLEITGGSESLELAYTENLTFVGSNANAVIMLDTDPVNAGNDGVDGGGVLSVIDASDYAGSLSLGKVKDIDSIDFAFTSGTGATRLTLIESTLNANPDNEPGWTFDLSSAAAGSVFEIGSTVVGTAVNSWTAGNLTITLGANTQLLISEDTDWTQIDNLIITGHSATNPIVLGAGVELFLTAEQASGLYIVAADGIIVDPNAAGYDANKVPTVNIVELDNDATYDFGHIQDEIAGKITLAVNDVEVMNATDLGAFSIELLGLGNNFGDGQTIRFNNVDQAAREITVTGTDTDGTNVVWLFTDPTAIPAGGVETRGYSADIGRVWFSDQLVDGQNVEMLFTRLDNQILRVEYTGDFELIARPIDRVVEIVAFTQLPNGLTFNDLDEQGFVRNLKIDLGGDVNIGSLNLDNVIGPNVVGDATFQTLTINSFLATTQGSRLMPETWRDGDAPPAGPNVIGDISGGAVHSLTDVILVNGTVEVGAVTNDLEIRTITFSSPTANDTANLTLIGAGEITVKALNAGANITGIIIDDAAPGFTGTADINGGSPAIYGTGLESITIKAMTVGATINIGWDEAGPDDSDLYPGIASSALTAFDASDFLGTLNVQFSEVNSEEFTFTAGWGETTVILDGDMELAATGEWVFNLSNVLDTGNSTLTITNEVDFSNGGSLTIIGPHGSAPALIIEDDVDLSLVDLTLIDIETIVVAEGHSLTLSVEQLSALPVGLNVVGSGTVFVVGEVDTDSVNVADRTVDLAQIRTVGVDLSGLTNAGVAVPQAYDVIVALPADGAIDDNSDPVGYNLIGSPFNDAITGSAGDDTIDGGAGDDTITGGFGNDTFLVTAGEDIITDLVSFGLEEDVLVVSAGATANAENIQIFVATADTRNAGTANLSTAANGAIDMTLAGGPNGYNLTGTDDQTNQLVGSAFADVINGGNNVAWQPGDILTGNGGNDRFVFNIDASDPVQVTQDTTTPGLDVEIWDIGAFTTDAADNTITVTFRNNGNTGSFVITAGNAPVLNTADNDAIGARLATELTSRGLASTYNPATDELTVTGTPGQGVEIIGIVGAAPGVGDVGTFNADTAEAATSDDGDVAQVTTVTIGGAVEDPAWTATAGETYTISVTVRLDIGTTTYDAEYVAVGTENEAALAAALETELAALVAGDAEVGTAVAGRVITITDSKPDNGGFTVSLTTASGIASTGASQLLVGDATDLPTADIITDFTAGQDTLSFEGMAAGSGANFASAGVQADYTTAFAAANTALGGAVSYYMTHIVATPGEAVAGVIAEGETIGLLFFDANGNGDADGVVQLVGVTNADINFSAIVAG